jgi:predicted transcriptional regulator
LHEKKNRLFEEIKKIKLIKYKNKHKPTDKIFKNYKKLKEQYLVSNEIWIFFDEFNTSVLQNYLSEMMIDRKSSLLPSHPQVNTNPFFIKKH